jgi:hypothetical protein
MGGDEVEVGGTAERKEVGEEEKERRKEKKKRTFQIKLPYPNKLVPVDGVEVILWASEGTVSKLCERRTENEVKRLSFALSRHKHPSVLSSTSSAASSCSPFAHCRRVESPS